MKSRIFSSVFGSKRVIPMILGTVLAVASCVAVYPQPAQTVHAVNVKTVSGLGTGDISNPSSASGGWDYVYYGNSSSNIRYRVLDTSATEFGGNTMLLDWDTTLFVRAHDGYVPYEYGSSGWTNSDVNCELYSTFPGMFTDQELAVVINSYKAAPAADDGDVWSVIGFTPLTGEKFFVLDAAEITRASYGYADCDARDANRVKSGVESWYWLRSPFTDSNNVCVSINPHGDVDGSEPYCECGVSPAFNIDRNSILFSSEIGSNEYKLTLIDSGLGIGITSGSSVSVNGNRVTVPYTITGSHASDATQVTVLIMDNEFVAGTSQTSGLMYIPLSVTNWGTSGTGEFILPDNYLNMTAGSDYFVYLIAEDVNDTYRTDYASMPAAIMGTPEPAPAPVSVDCMQPVEDEIRGAIAAGGEQSVVISVYSAISNRIMELLQANPQITLVMEFTYQGVDFRITIPGLAVQADPNIPWYGPLYLYPDFYMYGDPSPDVESYLAAFS